MSMNLRHVSVTLFVLLSAVLLKAKADDDQKTEMKPVKESPGFVNGKGTVFDLEVTKQSLYDLLIGEKVKADDLTCPSCKEAFNTDGVCTKCKLGFVKGRMYRSPYAYTMAKGEPYDPSKYTACKDVAGALAKNDFCADCGYGFVAHRAFKGVEDHHWAVVAYDTIKRAIARSQICETCGTAILTNGNCPKCKIAYRQQRAIN